MTEQEVNFMKDPENAFQCDSCPENRHDPDYKAGGRLPCGQWQCWVVLRTESWRKKCGKLTLDEITQACTEYEQDFYMLVICAMDRDISQYYEVDDLQGDYVTLYRADDFFKWREK